GAGAPLVDAAWRGQLGILDDCLEGVRPPPHVTLGFAIEMGGDARGRPTRRIVKAPAPVGGRVARWVGAATRPHPGMSLVCATMQQLRMTLIGAKALTLARTEMVVGTP